jgi:hypothetical protein
VASGQISMQIYVIAHELFIEEKLKRMLVREKAE